MKPAYWIGIMALVGGILGYALFKLTGWFDTGVGTAVGIMVGVVIYANQQDKRSGKA